MTTNNAFESKLDHGYQTPDMFKRLAEIDHWLDAAVPKPYKDQPMAQDWARISKVVEELGECIQVFIGLTGQNPRKGGYGTHEHLYKELLDVACTALLALQHFIKDDKELSYRLVEHVVFLHKRVMENGAT